VNSTSLSSPDGIFGEGRSYPQVPDVAAASGGRVRLAMRMTEYRGRFRHGAPAEAAWCSGACCRSPSITGKVSWWLVDGKDRRRRVYVYRSNLILNPCVYMAIFLCGSRRRLFPVLAPILSLVNGFCRRSFFPFSSTGWFPLQTQTDR
jgi:hypothetical protein